MELRHLGYRRTGCVCGRVASRKRVDVDIGLCFSIQVHRPGVRTGVWEHTTKRFAPRVNAT